MRNRFTDLCSRLWIRNPKVKVIDRYGDLVLVDLHEVTRDDREVSHPEIRLQPSKTARASVQQIMDILEDLSQVLPVNQNGDPEEYL